MLGFIKDYIKEIQVVHQRVREQRKTSWRGIPVSGTDSTPENTIKLLKECKKTIIVTQDGFPSKIGPSPSLLELNAFRFYTVYGCNNLGQVVCKILLLRKDRKYFADYFEVEHYYDSSK